jgi:hypothetical protein
MLLHPHVREVNSLAQLRNGETLAALNFGENKILLALGQFTQKFTFHKVLTGRAFAAFLSSLASRGQLDCNVKVAFAREQAFLRFYVKKVIHTLTYPRGLHPLAATL